MSFWSSSFDPPNPPLTDDLIRSAESALGVSLPRSYCELLRQTNGGYVNEQLVRVGSSQIPDALSGYISDGFVSVGSISGIGDGSDADGDILTSSYLIREWGLPERLVLLDGDGHSWVALDYRNHDGNDPPIIYIESDSGASIELARTFADFISSFIPFEDVYDEDGNLMI